MPDSLLELERRRPDLVAEISNFRNFRPGSIPKMRNFGPADPRGTPCVHLPSAIASASRCRWALLLSGHESFPLLLARGQRKREDSHAHFDSQNL